MDSYPAGNLITLKTTFIDQVTLLPADPTTVKLRVQDPSGTEVDYSILTMTHPLIGTYQQEITPTLPGIWKYRWEGTGAVISASESRFEVRASAFAAD
jgi:hypothetical protein